MAHWVKVPQVWWSLFNPRALHNGKTDSIPTTYSLTPPPTHTEGELILATSIWILKYASIWMNHKTIILHDYADREAPGYRAPFIWSLEEVDPQRQDYRVATVWNSEEEVMGSKYLTGSKLYAGWWWHCFRPRQKSWLAGECYEWTKRYWTDHFVIMNFTLHHFLIESTLRISWLSTEFLVAMEW